MNPRDQNPTFAERPADSNDESWLWELYSELLKPSITKQWGWDEEFQQTNFQNHLPFTSFSIIEDNESRIAAYAAQTGRNRILLHMILVTSERQLHGIGSYVIGLLKKRAGEMDLPIELSIFPANPVAGFYENNGFKIVEETTDQVLFRWVPE